MTFSHGLLAFSAASSFFPFSFISNCDAVLLQETLGLKDIKPDLGWGLLTHASLWCSCPPLSKWRERLQKKKKKVGHPWVSLSYCAWLWKGQAETRGSKDEELQIFTYHYQIYFILLHFINCLESILSKQSKMKMALTKTQHVILSFTLSCNVSCPLIFKNIEKKRGWHSDWDLESHSHSGSPKYQQRSILRCLFTLELSLVHSLPPPCPQSCSSLPFNSPPSLPVPFLPTSPPPLHPRQTKLIGRLWKSKDADAQKAKLGGGGRKERERRVGRRGYWQGKKIRCIGRDNGKIREECQMAPRGTVKHTWGWSIRCAASEGAACPAHTLTGVHLRERRNNSHPPPSSLHTHSHTVVGPMRGRRGGRNKLESIPPVCFLLQPPTC